MAVVVGVDGAGRSVTAIQLAAREADYRHAPLIAVMAYSGERALGAPAARPVASLRTGDDNRIAAESALQDAACGALGGQADGVRLRTIQGLAGRKLVETAAQAGAELIVLATRGSGPADTPDHRHRPADRHLSQRAGVTARWAGLTRGSAVLEDERLRRLTTDTGHDRGREVAELDVAVL